MTLVQENQEKFKLENCEAVDNSGLKKAAKFLEFKIAKAASFATPVAEIITINREIAAAMLARNPADENRKSSTRVIEAYASDMVAGRWKGLNGQTIVFSQDGYLNDGQHRLAAVIAADAAIPFTVIFGAERESRMTLDQNKVRTSGDYMSMAGVQNANHIAAIAATIYAYKIGALVGGNARNVMPSERRPTKARLHAFAMKHIEQISRAENVVYVQESRPLGSYAKIGAALCIIEDVAGFEAAREYITAIIYGTNLGKTDPIYRARERLLQERFSGGGSIPIRMLEILIRGWNAHRRGDRITRLVLNGTLPKVER
jgi:hypothetical protein